MDRIELLKHAEAFADIAWYGFCEINPTLHRVKKPDVKLNNRLKSTAGRAHYTPWFTEYSPELFEENFSEFAAWTFPHEVGHLVAYKLYGDAGHGHAWHKVMTQYCAAFGGTYSRCHPFNTKRMISRAAAK